MKNSVNIFQLVSINDLKFLKNLETYGEQNGNWTMFLYAYLVDSYWAVLLYSRTPDKKIRPEV